MSNLTEIVSRLQKVEFNQENTDKILSGHQAILLEMIKEQKEFREEFKEFRKVAKERFEQNELTIVELKIMVEEQKKFNLEVFKRFLDLNK
ncbi:hypothetical protein [Endozoicomonas sp. 4G]|uniref:hypothetical protein n=1 Tax=Endozoicomonas sp. 4G TaxID=2872754 RepID=UPI0020786539|nr:hypothetical protein [Endozoicomonas sp. 4G]